MFYNLLFYISKYHFEKSKTYSAGAYIYIYTYIILILLKSVLDIHRRWRYFSQGL